MEISHINTYNWCFNTTINKNEAGTPVIPAALGKSEARQSKV